MLCCRVFIILLLLLPCMFSKVQAKGVVITPSEVYAQVVLIEKETWLVKQYFNINTRPAPVMELTADIKPRHVWQKAYMLQMKLVMFRRKHQLNVLSPVGMEPVEQLDPRYTWEQTERILNEIHIIRRLLNIKGEVATVPAVTEDKTSSDVFNKLAQIEAEWDMLLGTGFDASYVFDQVLRLNEDVNAILNQLKVFDNAIPPEKKMTDTPANALAQAFLLLEQVQRLQKLLGLETVDFSTLRKTENVRPDDTFNLVCLILAELQQVKARIGLSHRITPVATFHENKTSADVRQLLGYIVNKLVLIEHL